MDNMIEEAAKAICRRIVPSAASPRGTPDMTAPKDLLATIGAHENGELVGLYVGPIRRAASWARRANPAAALRSHQENDNAEG